MSKLLQIAASETKKRSLEAEREIVSENKRKAKSLTTKKTSSSVLEEGSDIIYLGHIPRGFFEWQMRSFFSQFGEVEKVRLFRSKKSGHSKGYGFLKFESHEVAAVVAEAINGYHLSDRQLVCEVVPQSKVHEGMFLAPKKKQKQTNSTDEDEKNESSDEDISWEQRAAKYMENQTIKAENLKSLGIDYDILLYHDEIVTATPHEVRKKKKRVLRDDKKSKLKGP
eukprot:CAMPEP_0182421540 /NCGR_PEP_ID=MMETSP1167-20130531/6966_1 /TAXON_ID=2988 /ORGANISM="Mallomonas Sp, Strain CCMP3275" /LENGTH=224 /DNA_ID=CAMNT_0024598785 /DNA_START=74 /DNA_END=748 /DNA_ORIENTATION=+